MQLERLVSINKTVLVTGASGNLGSLICESLTLNGFDVLRASSKLSESSFYLDFENYTQTEINEISSAAEVVIHCARVTNLDSTFALESEMKFLDSLFLSGVYVIYIGSASSFLKTPNQYGIYKSRIEDYVIANGGSVATAGLVYGTKFQGQLEQIRRYLKYSPFRIVFHPVNSLYLSEVNFFINELILLLCDDSSRGRYLIAQSNPISFNSILRHFCFPGPRIPLRMNSRIFLKFLRILSRSTPYFSADSFSSLLSDYDFELMKKLGIKHIIGSGWEIF